MNIKFVSFSVCKKEMVIVLCIEKKPFLCIYQKNIIYTTPNVSAQWEKRKWENIRSVFVIFSSQNTGSDDVLPGSMVKQTLRMLNACVRRQNDHDREVLELDVFVLMQSVNHDV